MFVRFNPRRAVTTSIAKLNFASNADAATNSIQLVATSGASITTRSRSAAPSPASSRWT